MTFSVGAMADDAQIYPFRIEIPQADLDDLLARSRAQVGSSDVGHQSPVN